MIYIIRLLKLILWVLKHIGKWLLHIGVSALLVTQLIIVMLLFIPILVLQLVEFFIVRPIYYVINGKRYYDNYKPVYVVYCDFLDSRKIIFKKEDCSNTEQTYMEEPDFYERLYNKINDMKITL